RKGPLTRVLDHLGFAAQYCDWLTPHRPCRGTPWHTVAHRGTPWHTVAHRGTPRWGAVACWSPTTCSGSGQPNRLRLTRPSVWPRRSPADHSVPDSTSKNALRCPWALPSPEREWPAVNCGLLTHLS